MEFKNQNSNLQDVYHHSIISKNITLDIRSIGDNLREIIEKKLSYDFEGKCISEGYIKQNSVSIINYSSGKIVSGIKIAFDVTFECDICLPVEGMVIECIVKNVTKAGIRAEIDISDDERNSPLVIFIARDHHINNIYYNNVVENNTINIRVIGQRFELNDKYITIIAELIGPKNNYSTSQKKTKKLVYAK